MKEFGSDYHYIKGFKSKDKTLCDFYPRANYYADGRQALVHLYHSQGWQRLWIPQYFCYDVVESLRHFGLDIVFYSDYPDNEDDGETLVAILNKRLFRPTDAILRVNFFGIRGYRSIEKLPVAVVEDHTHDLVGDWAMKSKADWCIASLRKSLPLPEGGMLWSPTGLKLPASPAANAENERVAAIRWEAMKFKERYLAGDDRVEKATFRAGYVNTEPFFDVVDICALDKGSQEYLLAFDVWEWYKKKRENWELLRDIKKVGVRVLLTENRGCYPFSLVLVFDSFDERNRVRKELMAKQVYSAVLWNVPQMEKGKISLFSRCMLSLHCDGRYTKDDILALKSIIESIL